MKDKEKTYNKILELLVSAINKTKKKKKHTISDDSSASDTSSSSSRSSNSETEPPSKKQRKGKPKKPKEGYKTNFCIQPSAITGHLWKNQSRPIKKLISYELVSLGRDIEKERTYNETMYENHLENLRRNVLNTLQNASSNSKEEFLVEQEVNDAIPKVLDKRLSYIIRRCKLRKVATPLRGPRQRTFEFEKDSSNEDIAEPVEQLANALLRLKKTAAAERLIQANLSPTESSSQTNRSTAANSASSSTTSTTAIRVPF